MVVASGRLWTHAFIVCLCSQAAWAAKFFNVSISMPEECAERDNGGVRLYCIEVTPRDGRSLWRIMHRYQDFYDLSGSLGRHANFEDAPLPERIRMPCFRNVDQCLKDRFDKRRKGLQAWLQKVVDARVEQWTQLLGEFLHPSVKPVHRLVDNPKAWVRKTGSMMLTKLGDVKTLLKQKLAIVSLTDKQPEVSSNRNDSARSATRELPRNYGEDDVHEIEQTLQDVEKAEKEFEEIQESGSHEAITEAEHSLSDMIDEEQDKLQWKEHCSNNEDESTCTEAENTESLELPKTWWGKVAGKALAGGIAGCIAGGASGSALGPVTGFFSSIVGCLTGYVAGSKAEDAFLEEVQKGRQRKCRDHFYNEIPCS